LYMLQQSEYVRRLCLTNFRKARAEADRLDVSAVVSQHADEMTSSIQAAVARLEQVLEYSRMCSELGAEAKTAVPLSSGQMLPLSSVLSTILHNCLLEVRQLDDWHDGQVKEDENPKHWLQVLHDIQTQLRNCQDYLEESKENIVNRFNLDQEKSEMEISHPACFERANVSQDKLMENIKVIGETDAVVHVDEVFEAFIDSNTASIDSIDIDELKEDYNIKRLEEKNHSRKLLKELKSVLKVKEKEWIDREARALARIQNETITDSGSHEYKCDLPVPVSVTELHHSPGISSGSSCSDSDSGLELLGRYKQFKRPLRAAAVKQQAARDRVTTCSSRDRTVNKSDIRINSDITFSVAEAVAARCSQLRQQDGVGEEFFGECDSGSDS